MKNKCDKCDKPATIHLTEIIEGQKIEKHLCEDCAAEEGITIKANIPISQLLEDFILQAAPDAESVPDIACDVCGMKLGEFKNHGLLGCPNDYEVFDKSLTPMLARAHEGATQHVGKVPHRAGPVHQKQNVILRLRAELKKAIQAEQYEQAAALRDRIKEVENE